MECGRNAAGYAWARYDGGGDYRGVVDAAVGACTVRHDADGGATTGMNKTFDQPDRGREFDRGAIVAVAFLHDFGDAGTTDEGADPRTSLVILGDEVGDGGASVNAESVDQFCEVAVSVDFCGAHGHQFALADGVAAKGVLAAVAGSDEVLVGGSRGDDGGDGRAVLNGGGLLDAAAKQERKKEERG